MKSLIALVLIAFTALPAIAGEADVLAVEVSCNSRSVCRFDVTVRHGDEGWEHYSNKWDVLTPDGDVIATRELLHPHETEQPFTRSLTDVNIPAGLHEVVVRAHDLIHGYGGEEIVVTLPAGN
jgi:hypothetical protein